MTVCILQNSVMKYAVSFVEFTLLSFVQVDNQCLAFNVFERIDLFYILESNARLNVLSLFTVMEIGEMKLLSEQMDSAARCLSFF